jgi:hypothetical protein
LLKEMLEHLPDRTVSPPAAAHPGPAGYWLAVDHGLQEFSSSDREWATDFAADQPTGNLDSKNSEIVLKLLADLNRRLGQTMLLIKHNPDAAALRIVH